MEQKLVEIPLREIKPDPTQPRKQYDESALNELAASIASIDVQEPILVRPKGKAYMIVFGERRWRASKLARKETIPAMVKDLTDAEVLEAQLAENMHRVDPHPMDEATAFKRFVDLKKMPLEEIAAKLGKTVFYIRQRLKLVELIVAWQTVFFRNIISITNALQIAQLPKETQETMYDLNVDESLFTKSSYKVDFTELELDKYKGNLAVATFDTTDPALHDNGACTACPFNTCVASLFPDDIAAPRCTNIKCYTQKTNNAFKLNLEQVKKDPAMVLVSDYGAANKKLKTDLVKQGIQVLDTHEYNAIDKPVKPDWNEFKANNPDMEEEDRLEEFQYANNRYDEAFKLFQQKIDAGKYLKAFVVDGHDAGTTQYISLVKKKKPAAGQQTDTAGQDDVVTASTIREEISRIEDKEKRSKELDSVKVLNQVKAALAIDEGFLQATTPLTVAEYIAMAILAYHESYPVREFLRKELKVKSEYDYQPIELFTKLFELEGDKIVIICLQAMRRLMLDKLIAGGSVEQDPNRHAQAAAIKLVAVKYIPDVLATFSEEQRVKANERGQRVDARIGQLIAQLAKLQEEKPVKKQGIKALTEG